VTFKPEGHIVSGSIDPDKISISTSKIKPTGRQVVIKMDPLPEKSEGGLWLAGDARNIDYEFATVMAVGPGDFALKTGIRMPLDVKVGDRVILGRYCGADFEFEGEKLKILPEEQIYCIVEDE
jgi:chaperonin GroES